MAWWDDLWLNEGFASYVEYIGSDKVVPEYQMVITWVSVTVLCLRNFRKAKQEVAKVVSLAKLVEDLPSISGPL